MKILPKILLPVLVSTSICLFVSTVYTYQTSMDALKEASITSQKMAISNALVELKAGLDFNILNAISLAQTGILQPYLSGNYQNFVDYSDDALSRIINMRNTYHYVMLGIINTDGTVLTHTEQKFIGQNFSDRPFFQKAMEGEVAIGSPYQYNNEVVYAVASPVHDINTNAIIGVVFNVSRLVDTMSERMLLGEHGYIYVADKLGTIFIHKHSDRVFQDILNNYDWWHEMVKIGSGSTTYVFQGREKIAYFDTLPKANWIAVAVKDVKELSIPGRNLRNSSILMAAVMLILLTAIIYTYISYILSALLKAVKYANQVANGILDKDLDLGAFNDSAIDRIVNKSKAIFTTKSKQEAAQDQAKTMHSLSEFKRNDEIGDLYEALQTMVHSMRTMVQKADESSKMKSEFLANMSHEIRTPLNAVIGLAHLCLKSTEDNKKKDDYIKKIEVAGKSLLGIINNVLDTSKIEAGMLELEHLHFNLREVCEQTLVIYRDGAETKNLSLDLEIAPDMHNFYAGDPVRIGQILNNFVGNAIKFTEQGKVCISCFVCNEIAENVEIPPNTEPVCIRVSDTGIGISDEQVKSLFKPFAQADSSITRRFGGTGLGLVISKHLIELMNGKLFVTSDVGKGTTFTILLFLPPTQDTNIKVNNYDEKTLDLSDKRVLVVEDNMINQLIMEELLQKTNAKVSIADNGQIAVNMLENQTFDIVLMDMQMPVMDGIQATGIIRQKFSMEDLPIIAVTANAMKEDKEKGIQMGLNDYLTKPIDPLNLMMVLQYWLCKN